MGLNSQTGIIMSLLGAVKEEKDESKKKETGQQGAAANGHPAGMISANGLTNGEKKAEQAAAVVIEDENAGRNFLFKPLVNKSISTIFDLLVHRQYRFRCSSVRKFSIMKCFFVKKLPEV